LITVIKMKIQNRKHRINYAEFFNIGEQDMILCEVCQKNFIDHIHHINYRGRGGGDEIENCIGLCSVCHNLCHDEKLLPEFLYKCHKFHMDNKDNII
jgi:hypothetical protein